MRVVGWPPIYLVGQYVVGAIQRLAAKGMSLPPMDICIGLPVNMLRIGEICQSLVSVLAMLLPTPGLVATSVVLKPAGGRSRKAPVLRLAVERILIQGARQLSRHIHELLQ